MLSHRKNKIKCRLYAKTVVCTYKQNSKKGAAEKHTPFPWIENFPIR